MITIQIEDVALRTWLKRAEAAGKSPEFLGVLGREARNTLRKHYLGRQAKDANKLGGKRTNFWRSVAQSVQSPVIAGTHTVTVAISHPAIRQKVEGGTIVPKRVRALTIPVSPEAYGRTAETLEHELGIKLFRVPSDLGNGVLAAAMKDGRIKVHYALRRSVHQNPDPEALPPTSSLVSSLIARAQAWWARVTGSK